ncbi:MAG: hypothetical protein CLLPBCKN_007007 [Chroococcidiopsis cubana SAG 39.79]|nr:VTT domain-containing protein [Chroococcidiopsis cubana]MDZ4877572.1 hypothetical protein [Chroococcidiopsis cubana SAG 39.79]
MTSAISIYACVLRHFPINFIGSKKKPAPPSRQWVQINLQGQPKFSANVSTIGQTVVLCIDRLRTNIAQFGIWAPFAILCLRLTSIAVPALPSTAYATLSGALFGFAQGVMTIAIADFLACTTNSFIARRSGRPVVQRLVGERFMDRLARWSRKYLEGNFFLMTSALMSGFFDYVCYAAGLTQMPWKRFLSTLGLSIALVKPPVVVVGAGILQGEKLLIGALVVGMLAIAIVSAWTRRKGNQTEDSDL